MFDGHAAPGGKWNLPPQPDKFWRWVNEPGIPQVIRECRARWYFLKEHPQYAPLVSAVSRGVRFPIVAAGRRSGKTEKLKRFVAKRAMAKEQPTDNPVYFLGAPTRDQVKRIFWKDMKLLTFACAHSRQPMESDLKIFLPNGAEIQLVGLDKPSRFEGVNWTGGGIDEIADVKGAALQENIMPALDTLNPINPEYRAWCWFTGVPDGFNHFYDMAQDGKDKTITDYEFFTWTSAEILDPAVIEMRKRTMGPRQFRTEFEASFESAAGRIYEDYDAANYTDKKILPHEKLLWTHDQNFTPLSSAIGVVRRKKLYLLDEIVLTSAVSRQSASEFVEKYRNHQNKSVVLFGDASGRKGEKHGHESDYREIESVLRENGWEYEREVPLANPPIKDRQNSLRALIKNALGEVSLYVNRSTAPWCHKALSTVQVKEGSTFQEDDKNEYQHISTAIGYLAHKRWPVESGTVISNTPMRGAYG